MVRSFEELDDHCNLRIERSGDDRATRCCSRVKQDIDGLIASGE